MYLCVRTFVFWGALKMWSAIQHHGQQKAYVAYVVSELSWKRWWPHCTLSSGVQYLRAVYTRAVLDPSHYFCLYLQMLCSVHPHCNQFCPSQQRAFHSHLPLRMQCVLFCFFTRVQMSFVFFFKRSAPSWPYRTHEISVILSAFQLLWRFLFSHIWSVRIMTLPTFSPKPATRYLSVMVKTNSRAVGGFTESPYSAEINCSCFGCD